MPGGRVAWFPPWYDDPTNDDDKDQDQESSHGRKDYHGGNGPSVWTVACVVLLAVIVGFVLGFGSAVWLVSSLPVSPYFSFPSSFHSASSPSAAAFSSTPTPSPSVTVVKGLASRAAIWGLSTSWEELGSGFGNRLNGVTTASTGTFGYGLGHGVLDLGLLGMDLDLGLGSGKGWLASASSLAGVVEGDVVGFGLGDLLRDVGASLERQLGFVAV